jgi:transposase
VLTGKYHLSKRLVEELLLDRVGVPLSLGSVSNLEQRVSEALAEPACTAMESVAQAPVVHQDETTWWLRHVKIWLWVVVTPLVTVFQIALRRGGAVSRQMLGEDFAGTLISDRYSSYLWVPDEQRQFCWSHLKQDFLELVQAGGPSAGLGQRLGAIARTVFRYWHRVRDGKLLWFQLWSRLAPVRRRMRKLLQEGAWFHQGKAQGLCKYLREHDTALWRFARVPGVEPTNNAAERALRQAVLWRRQSLGTQSLRGCLFVQRILTVVATLRQQRRHVLEYLTQAIQAHLNHERAPPLVPEPLGLCAAAA